MPSTRVLAQRAIPDMTPPIEILVRTNGGQDDAEAQLAEISERQGARAVHARLPHAGDVGGGLGGAAGR
jgi:hypothetical protein